MLPDNHRAPVAPRPLQKTSRWKYSALSAVVVMCLLLPFALPSKGQEATTSISSAVPSDCPGSCTLTDAAIFAWQEFIALNWPADLGGSGVPRRGVPSQQSFGTPNVPLVWHTFAGKVEIFPGQGEAQPFNSPPSYRYSSGIGPCSGHPSAQPAWINLDETTQIGSNKMYAGILSNYQPQVVNSEPKLILFMAKVNEQEYSYIKRRGWDTGGVSLFEKEITTNEILHNMKDPPADNSIFVSFPFGSIEVKAAFRPLSPSEDPKRFYRTRVRYYEPRGSGQCYVEDDWALVGLHIIQKTPKSPAFIYATFEQADNIVDRSGKPTEDPNGEVIIANNGASTFPALSFKDSNRPYANPAVYPMVSTNPPGQGSCPESVNGKLLYYTELGPYVPPISICQVARNRGIPAEIVNANNSMHGAINRYLQHAGLADAPWRYYKLINVQTVPIDKFATTQPGQTYQGRDAATYYQANAVVETDYALQNFSTAFFMNFAAGPSAKFGPPTDFQVANPSRPPTTPSVAPPFYNTYFEGQKYGMGGCMGCHGSAQVKGTDFSFITLLAGHRPLAPETPSEESLRTTQELYRKVFGHALPEGESKSH